MQKWWNKIQGIVRKIENPCKKVNFSNTTQVWDKKGTNCNSSMEVTFAFRLVLLLQLSLSSLPLIYFDNYFSWLLLFVHALECTFLQEIREKLRPRKFEDQTNSKQFWQKPNYSKVLFNLIGIKMRCKHTVKLLISF